MAEKPHDPLFESNLLSRITLDPNICHGTACIRGLRYPVETILEPLSSRISFAQLLEDYPGLGQEDLQAVAMMTC